MQAVQVDPELLKRGNDLAAEVADSMQGAWRELVSLQVAPDMFGSTRSATEIKTVIPLVRDQLCRLLDEGHGHLSWIIQNSDVLRVLFAAADQEGAEVIRERAPGLPPTGD
ncbi:hypothetical protein ACFZC5_08955 [Nocardia gamkensis]|uniref:hypothetical protein n=1 Tax=Nocardia gamkensis TaxID=352869 RepID=UPI0036EAD59C